jgi:hypothetical protein
MTTTTATKTSSEPEAPSKEQQAHDWRCQRREDIHRQVHQLLVQARSMAKEACVSAHGQVGHDPTALGPEWAERRAGEMGYVRELRATLELALGLTVNVEAYLKGRNG